MQTLILLLASMLGAPDVPKHTGTTYHLDVTDPEKEGSTADYVKIKVTPATGGAQVEITLKADVPEGMSSQDKAAEIASAVEYDDENTDGMGGKLITSVNIGRTVSFVGLEGNKIAGLTYVNHSKQSEMALRKTKPSKTGSGVTPSAEVEKAKSLAVTFALEGEPLGVTDQFLASQIQIGFVIGKKTLIARTTPFSQASAIEALGLQLRHKGFRVDTNPLEGSLTVWPEAPDLEEIVFGGNDRGASVVLTVD